MMKANLMTKRKNMKMKINQKFKLIHSKDFI